MSKLFDELVFSVLLGPGGPRGLDPFIQSCSPHQELSIAYKNSAQLRLQATQRAQQGQVHQA